jgi:3-methyladenine DNA glycosylase AlkD
LAFEHLAPRLAAADLAAIEAIFRAGLLFDWNNTDWFCVKVLDKLVRRDIEFARPIAGWTTQADAPLWQRRAGAVAFVPVAKHGIQPPSSPELWDLMWMAARNNVRSPERFMQTSVGWLVRELGRADQDAALAFLAEHRALLSREAARYIVEKLPADVQAAALAG